MSDGGVLDARLDVAAMVEAFGENRGEDALSLLRSSTKEIARLRFTILLLVQELERLFAVWGIDVNEWATRWRQDATAQYLRHGESR